MRYFRKMLAAVLALAVLLSLLASCVQPSQPQAPTDPDKGLFSEDSTKPTLGGLAGEYGLVPEPTLVKPLVDKAGGSAAHKQNTVMIYMCGSDLESNYGCASEDLAEIVNSGLKGSNANVLIMTGGSKAWSLGIPSNQISIYRLTDDGSDLEMVACSNGPCNMGQPQLILDLLNIGYTDYPANRYSLIFWDHGGGPLYGFCNDELYDYDSISLPELEAALEASPFGPTNKLAFVGFDACLMGNLETALVLDDYAAYMVASQELEPGSGWDYSFLSVLNVPPTTGNLVKSILQTYEQSMTQGYWVPEYTLSCVQLDRVTGLTSTMGDVWQSVNKNLDSDFSRVSRTIGTVKHFGMSGVSDPNQSLDLVDLLDAAQKLAPDASGRLQAAMQIAVPFNVSNVEGANGLSFYLPHDNKALFQNAGNYLLYQDSKGHYASFVGNYASKWLGGRSGQHLGADQLLQSQDQCLSIQLTPGQLDNLGLATYTILQYDPEADYYRPVLAGIPVTPDDSGIVRIPRDLSVYRMHTDLTTAGEKSLLWPLRFVDSNSQRTRYNSINAILLPTSEVIASNYEFVTLTCSTDSSGGNAQIQSILLDSNTSSGNYGKQDVDISDYAVLGSSWLPLHPTEGADGYLLPWNQWDQSSGLYIGYSNYDRSFWLEQTPLNQEEGIFLCQVVVTDSYGNVIGTRMETLWENLPYTAKTVSMEQGDMTFRVYSDHAEVTGFQATPGPDTFTYANHTVTVPEAVDGVPVTVIGNRAFSSQLDIRQVILPESILRINQSAFSSCYHLEQVNIPSGVKVIEDSAFFQCSLTGLVLSEGLQWVGPRAFAGNEFTQVTLPASLSYLGPGAFGYCDGLTAIEVAQGSAAYSSRDGVLYNTDGTELLAFPNGKTDSFRIPDGVGWIGEGAFIGNEMLTQIQFPDGLVSIGNNAFRDVLWLEEIVLPQSLEYIGSDAFGLELTYYSFEGREQTTLPVIQIGPNVKHIGVQAFSAYLVERYQVDPANEAYSAVNGCLLGSSGTELVQLPTAYAGSLTLPEGINYVHWSAFDDCDGITELILPDSLVSIHSNAGAFDNLEHLVVGKNLKQWDNLHELGRVKNLEIHSENPFYRLGSDGCVYSGDGTELLLLRTTQTVFAIPEGVTTLDRRACTGLGSDETALRTLILPASLTNVEKMTSFHELPGLEELQVAQGNPSFQAHDGLLYSADGKTLLCCPRNKAGVVTVQPGTQELGVQAFLYMNPQMQEVILPEGLTCIRNGNLQYSPYGSMLKLTLPASLTDIAPETLKGFTAKEIEVHCPAGSTAETFARNLGLPVIHD